MHPGIFVAASDAFEFFNSEGDWSFTKPGFTALAHPSTIEIGTTHGVFVLAGEFYTNKVHVPIVSSHLMNIHLTTQQIKKLKNHKDYCGYNSYIMARVWRGAVISRCLDHWSVTGLLQQRVT